MRILFLTHYFPPEVNAPASRTFEHCREWVKTGSDVTVITCAPNHPQGELYPGYRNRLYQQEWIQGIRVIRIWTLLAANEGFAMRTLNYLSYMVNAILAAVFLPRFDIVISTSPQFFCGFSGYFVSRLKRIPWVVEIRDLWPDSILTVGAIKNKNIIRLLKKLEYFMYQKSDHIVAVTDAFSRHIAAMGFSKSKIDVIKNGVDLSFYTQSTVDLDYKKSLGLQNCFVVSYVGTHGMAHHLQTVLEAAKKLETCPDLRFLLVGDGAERKKLLQLQRKLGLKNVVMLGQQPKHLMPKIWGITDVSLIHLKKSDLFTSVIPSKLFESMAMQKPVVLGVNGESRRILEQARAGEYVEPENAGMLADAVLELFKDSSRCARMGENGRNYVENFCDRTLLAQDYLGIIERCINRISVPVMEDR